MNVNAVIRASLFFTISITLGEICNIHQTVLCVFLGPAIISGHKFSSRVSTVFIARIFGTVVLGNLVGEVFYTNQLFGIVISALLFWGLLTYIKYPSKILAYTSPIFLYCYAFINTTSGVLVENTIYELFQTVTFMLPIGWLCFRLFPSHGALSKRPQPNQEHPISEPHKLLIVGLITCALTTFLAFEISGAIFCLSVVINVALRSSIKKGKTVIASIFPVQITGCLIGVLFHFLMLGHPNNIALFSVLLFIFTSIVHYFSFNKELRHKDIPNFEVGFMSAVLVPVTLYTHSNGFNIEPFIERSFDMACIWVILKIVTFVVLQVKNKSAPQRTTASA
ncbi:hypothetical protein ACK14O_14680 [Vibrio harveyi]|uniref:hypothetical protein n=1 Tax=Vibrio harveyi TaxID=669 RepID=UPI00390A22BC